MPFESWKLIASLFVSSWSILNGSQKLAQMAVNSNNSFLRNFLVFVIHPPSKPIVTLDFTVSPYPIVILPSSPTLSAFSMQAQSRQPRGARGRVSLRRYYIQFGMSAGACSGSIGAVPHAHRRQPNGNSGYNLRRKTRTFVAAEVTRLISNRKGG